MGTIKIKEIKVKSPLAKKCAGIIQEYSWGDNYPVKAWSELKCARYIIAVFDRKKIVGCSSVTRIASPDKIDNGKLWLANAIVLPNYRKKGIFKLLYNKQFKYAEKYNEPIFSCTSNPVIEKFLLKNRWVLYRITKDESGEMCKVFIINPTQKHLKKTHH